MKGSPIILCYRGEELTLTQAAARSGLSRDALYDRLSAGWGHEHAIDTPRQFGRHPQRYRFRGQFATIREIAAALGLSFQAVWKRIEGKKSLDTPAEADRMLKHAGRRQSVTAWAQEIGIAPRTLRQRLLHGWTVAEALTIPALAKGQRKPAPRPKKKLIPYAGYEGNEAW